MQASGYYDKTKKEDYWMGRSEINWNMVAIFVMVILAQWQMNATWQKNEMDSQEGKLATLDNKITELTGRLNIISIYLAQQGLTSIYGLPLDNESKSNLRDINISIPINESYVSEIFSVQGKANLSDLDNIYVLSKINSKYWILTDGISDSTGKWKGVKSCTIPISNESECERFELLAIITQGTYGIGHTFDKIPYNLAKSNSIYVRRC
jgi:hypothetical protein